MSEICVLGARDPSSKFERAEKLLAVIVPDFDYLKAHHIANAREGTRFELDSLGRELPEYQRVRDYIIRSEPLPRTTTRKVKRFELKNKIESSSAIRVAARQTGRFDFSSEDRTLMTGCFIPILRGIRRDRSSKLSPCRYLLAGHNRLRSQDWGPGNNHCNNRLRLAQGSHIPDSDIFFSLLPSYPPVLLSRREFFYVQQMCHRCAFSRSPPAPIGELCAELKRLMAKANALQAPSRWHMGCVFIGQSLLINYPSRAGQY